MILANNKGSLKSNIKSNGKICGKLKKYAYKNNKFIDSIIIQHLK